MKFALASISLLAAVSLSVLAFAEEKAAAVGEWKSLFNGKDLSGWDTYLGPPRKLLNRDPDRVFTVVDAGGAPAIRISGEIYGAITTHEEFEDFHIRVEFKWGEKRWPPREKVGRDSGILYNCIGPDGAGSGAWMRSVECNIMEKGCGQWWSVAGTIADVEGVGMTPEMEPRVPYKKEGAGESIIVYKKGAPKLTAQPSDGVTPAVDPEKPLGEWNTVEVVCFGADSIHIVNGVVNLVLTNSRFPEGGRDVPLVRGEIQLQSEAAEVFYRKVEIRSLKVPPPEYRQHFAEHFPGHFPGRGETGFAPLLDDEHLAGWAQCGPGSFKVEKGVATGVGGMGLWWYRKKTFGDFILRGEFLQEDGADSGVFLRFPDPANDPWIAVKQGHEFEIGDPKPAKGSTGSIYNFQAPSECPLKPAGEWNEYEIACTGKRYQVTLNGKLINDFTDAAGRPLSGHIGLQNYPYEKQVKHRNLRIKEVR